MLPMRPIDLPSHALAPAVAAAILLGLCLAPLAGAPGAAAQEPDATEPRSAAGEGTAAGEDPAGAGRAGEADVEAYTPDPGPLRDVFVDRLDVHVVNVDVYVTDRKGNRVEGLTADDFELLENGKPVTITNFYVVHDGLPTGSGEEDVPEPSPAVDPGVPAPIAEQEVPRLPEEQRLSLVVYVDNFNITPLNRNRVMRHVRRFLLERLDPGDRVMLVSYDRSLHVRQPFTTDPRLVAEATLELERMTASGSLRDSEWRETLDRVAEAETARDALIWVRQYAESAQNDLAFSVGALKEIVGSLAGLPGRKALLYVSDGVPMVAGQALFRAVDRRFPGEGSQQMTAFDYDYSRRFRELAYQANANRVTFYTLDAAGLRVPESFSASTRGGGTLGLGALIDSARHMNLQSPLRFLADSTGGISILNTNNVFDGLARAADDFDSYYSLGYTPSHAGDGRYYRLEVKVRGKRLSVRHREGYRDLSTETRLTDNTLAALYHSIERNPLGISLHFEPGERRHDGFWEVPVKLRVPIGKLTLVPAGDSWEGRMKVFIAAMDGRGGTSPVQQVPVELSIPEAEIERALEQDYVYTMPLLMRPGEQRVAVTLRDEFGAEVAYITRVVRLAGGKG